MELSFRDGIAYIKLDDGKANALCNQRFRLLNSFLDKVEASEARCVVLVSGRPGVFSGGLNLRVVPKYNVGERRAFDYLFPQSMLRLFHFPLPTIALLNGHAIAGGCIFALACDRIYAVASPELKDRFVLQMNEVLINMAIPEWLHPIMASHLPSNKRIDFLMYGEPLTFKEAHKIGIIKRLFVKEEDMLNHVKELVQSDAYGKLSFTYFGINKNLIQSKL